MNGWSPDQIQRIEDEAAKIESLWSRTAFLHKETGLFWHVCIAWAQSIRWKYKLVNGDNQKE